LPQVPSVDIGVDCPADAQQWRIYRFLWRTTLYPHMYLNFSIAMRKVCHHMKPIKFLSFLRYFLMDSEKYFSTQFLFKEETNFVERDW